MDVEASVEKLEGELKLVKNEIKQGLTGLHEFLTNLKTPSTPALLDVGEESRMDLGGGLEISNKKNLPSTLPALDMPAEPPEGRTARRQPPAPKEPPAEPAGETAERIVESFRQPQPDLAQDTRRSEETNHPYPPHDPAAAPPRPGVPLAAESEVNMLANLLGWVSQVKQRLGAEHLPTILEVYGMCSNLSPRTKKIILRLAELDTGPDRAEGSPEVWSQLVLQLHGIITGHISPDTPCSNRGEEEADSAGRKGPGRSRGSLKDASGDGDRPFRLKLVLPDEDGRDRELNLGEFKMENHRRREAK